MRKFDSFLFYIEQTILKVMMYYLFFFFVIAHYAVVAVGAQTDEYSPPSKFYKH